MTAKTINWNKAYSIAGTAAVVFAAVGWTFMKASTYAALPAQVSDHERRISTLESQSATNAVRLDDRLDRIDSDLRVIFKCLGERPRVIEQESLQAATTNSLAKGN